MHLNLLRPLGLPKAFADVYYLRAFLRVAAEFEGARFNEATQFAFFTRIVQECVEGIARGNFFAGMPVNEYRKAISQRVMPRAIAEAQIKRRYKNPNALSREFLRTLEMGGFIHCGYKIALTESGRAALAEETTGEDIFLRFLMKWQLPNPMERAYPASHGWEIKPFVGILHLMLQVRGLCEKQGLEDEGLSMEEFEMFALTLMSNVRIKERAEEIVARRRGEKTHGEDGEFSIKKHRVLSDNLLRCFLHTKFFSWKNDFQNIALAESRLLSIAMLLSRDDAAPRICSYGRDYFNYLASWREPRWLSGKSKEELQYTGAYLYSTLIRLQTAAGGSKLPTPK